MERDDVIEEVCGCKKLKGDRCRKRKEVGGGGLEMSEEGKAFVRRSMERERRKAEERKEAERLRMELMDQQKNDKLESERQSYIESYDSVTRIKLDEISKEIDEHYQTTLYNTRAPYWPAIPFRP